MLELNKITKTYEIGKKKDKDYQRVEALKGVDIKFRQSEFVSILGPSGCGKTTLLNIIGGLDKYTSGDLIINGKSTKSFTDKDWDTYRNHSVGFVFQSYNLIPHQSVLENVEIALTLSGVSKEERKNRAIEVLKRVGLGDKIHSKPNQLSGGQMQRVAIARALVNNPDVILADEPTGALDSKTSVQIMELLKEIANEKLIIMVTHNPDLAEEYSTRIIKLKDGELIEDSNPIVEEALVETGEEPVTIIKKEKKKTSMSFSSALSLSFKNLLTKKARTLLVSIAGSIGIIGIALILALSSGFQAYINKTQEDTLSSYPITINKTNTDFMALALSLFTGTEVEEHEADGIYASDTMSGVFEEASKQVSKINDLDAFSKYIEEHKNDLEGYVSAIQYTYKMNFYVSNPRGGALVPTSKALYEMILMYACSYLGAELNVTLEETGEGMFKLSKNVSTPASSIAFLSQHLEAADIAELNNNGFVNVTETKIVALIKNAMGMDISTYANMPFNIFNEMIDNETLLKSQYELLGSQSEWANEENEVMLVLSPESELDDYILYALGLITKQDMQAHMDGLFDENKTQLKLSYNDMIGKEYRILLESDYYYYDEIESKWIDIRTLEENEYKDKYNALLADPNVGKTVKITGVVRLNENTESGQLKEGIVYTSKLTQALINYHNNSSVVKSGQVGTPSEISLVPESISFYATSFEAKEVIENFISTYNANVEEDKKIDYTDYIGLMMSSISTIINAISYILIGFVSVSLVVSSIMIGIITYISVLERIKEIGILRAVGASKKDIKRVFTAETLIIGFVAGVLGILITLLLTIPVNIIIKALTGISGVAKLPWLGAIILIAISMLLTFIAGLIPSKIASKKDPVIALRSE